MEPTIIVAGISAAAATASLAATIHLAKKARHASIELEKIKLQLKAAESTASAIKELEVEGERLRIRGWELIGVAHALATPPTDHARDAGKKRTFTEASTHFGTQADSFLEKWAYTKTELPEGIVELLRTLRHRCRKQIEIISVQCALLRKPAATESHEIDILCTALQDLLTAVDPFIAVASTVRKALINGNLPNGGAALQILPRTSSAPLDLERGL